MREFPHGTRHEERGTDGPSGPVAPRRPGGRGTGATETADAQGTANTADTANAADATNAADLPLTVRGGERPGGWLERIRYGAEPGGSADVSRAEGASVSVVRLDARRPGAPGVSRALHRQLDEMARLLSGPVTAPPSPLPGLRGRLIPGGPPAAAQGCPVDGGRAVPAARAGTRSNDSAPAPAPAPAPTTATAPVRRRPDPGSHELIRAADEFVVLHHTEERLGDPARRLAAVRAEIADTGTYRHTTGELVFGARVAWRNANRCIGRLYWNSLTVRDRRDVRDARGVAEESAEHLREATRDGRIRALITVFAPDAPDRPAPRIWNEQLIRYAGYTRPDGGVTGDPRTTGLTDTALRLGWPGGPGTPFDVLPLLVQEAGSPPRWFELPGDAVLEVELTHPEHPWWRSLGLRWHAVPALSDMCLEIGGICYPTAPFNGWYMGTEIGARNLADTDRYDLLPTVAERLGLDTRTDRSLWKDRALVELNRSVLHSFDRAGVTVTDHHTESRRFLTHLGREERKGRQVGADWSWIVPPISASATPVFHRTYETVERNPAYVHHPDALERARGVGDF